MDFGSLPISVTHKLINTLNYYFILIFMNVYYMWLAEYYSEPFFLKLPFSSDQPCAAMTNYPPLTSKHIHI